MKKEFFETAHQWKMSETEASALRICFYYVEIYNKLFPDERKISISKKGDPRNSSMFRYAWKLLRETKDKLKPEEYPLYVQAQLHTLKHLGDKKEHARIDSNCLCGDKAWIRWKMWKRKYDKVQAKVTSINEMIDEADKIKVRKILENDVKFLVKNLGEDYKNKLIEEINFIRKSLDNGKLSFYYIILSPLIQKNIQLLKCDKDLSVYSSKIDDKIKDYFEVIDK